MTMMKVPVWARTLEASSTESAAGEPRLNQFPGNPLVSNTDELRGTPFLVDIPDEVSSMNTPRARTRLQPRRQTSSASDSSDSSDSSTGYLEEGGRANAELESASGITRPASAPPAVPASTVLPLNWSSPLLTPAFSSAVSLRPASAEVSTLQATTAGAPRSPIFRLQKRSARLPPHATEDHHLDNSLTGFIMTAALRDPGNVFRADGVNHHNVVDGNNDNSSDDIHSCAVSSPPGTPPRGSSSSTAIAPAELCLSDSLFMPAIG